MRLFLATLCCLFFCVSCSPYIGGQYFTSPPNSLSAIPLRPHNNEVDVFFNQEKPTVPYYKVKLVETQASPDVSADEMLNRLKQKAKEEGVDAVIVSDIGRQFNTTTSLPAGDGSIAYQKLTGIGLKYKERIDYMSTILKEQVVRLWPDDNPDPKIFSMSYDFSAKNISLKDEFIRQFFYNEIYLFEDHQSIYAPLEDWEYRMDTLNHLFSKRRMLNAGVYQLSIFKLTQPGNIPAIIKTSKGGNTIDERFELERIYTQQGLLVEKKLKKRKTKEYIWIEDISYRLNGLPDKITRYKIDHGKQVLFFEIQNKYYSANDLPATDN